MPPEVVSSLNHIDANNLRAASTRCIAAPLALIFDNFDFVSSANQRALIRTSNTLSPCTPSCGRMIVVFDGT